jgi:sec-independent protein translocase protein TatC
MSTAKLTEPPKADDPVDEVEASRAPLMDHLVELRNRMVRSLIVLVVLFFAAWYVTQPVLGFLLKPLGDAAARAGQVIHDLQSSGAADGVQQPAANANAAAAAQAGNALAQSTSALEVIFVKLKIAFMIALAVGFPYIAYQVYAFVAPGLYKSERAAVLPFLFVMPLLFVAGAAVVYYFVLPLFMDLSYSQEFTANGVTIAFQPKVKEYYGLAISLLTAFGLAFQLPVVLALLAKARVVSASGLRKGRKYAFVVIVIVAAVMTPPDPFSLFFLSVPLYFLYESGIIAAALIERGRKKREEADAKAEAEEAAREANEARPA